MTQTTELEETTERGPARNRFAQAHFLLLYFLGGALVIWLLTGFYQVQPDQVAIVERLGQYITGPDGRAATMEHGLHYHLPWPIDRVHVLSTQQRMTLNVKVFNTSPAEYDDFKRQYMNNPENPFMGNPQAMNAIFNPYLIAADKSVVQMEMSVTFRVRDPELWLQSISHEYSETYNAGSATDMRNELLQELAQHAMITEASRLGFEELLLEKRDHLPDDLKGLLEREVVIQTTDGMDPKKAAEIGLGVEVMGVQVTAVHAPDAIQFFYNRVLEERVKRDTAITVAKGEAQTGIQRAKGEKETLRVDAEAYKNAAIQRATGEKQRFEQVLGQYLLAPEVTRYSLYVDAMTSVTGNAKRIIFVRPGEKVYWTVDAAEYDPNQVKPGK